MAIIFQLLSIFGFSIGNSLWHKPVQKLPISFIIALKSLITTVLFFVVIVVVTKMPSLNFGLINHNFSALNLSDIAFAFLLCGVSFWGLFFFNMSLKQTATGVTITVSGAGTIISFLIAVFVYHEKFTGFNLLSSFIGLLGLWCLENLNPQFFKFKFTKGMLFALLSMAFWRVGGFFPLSINKVGVLQFCLILEFTVFFISSLIYIFFSDKLTIAVVKPHLYIILAIALSNFVGILGSNLALKFTSLVTFTLIGIIAPVITFTISLLFYKEKYTLIQYFGIILLIFGGIVISYFNK